MRTARLSLLIAIVALVSVDSSQAEPGPSRDRCVWCAEVAALYSGPAAPAGVEIGAALPSGVETSFVLAPKRSLDVTVVTGVDAEARRLVLVLGREGVFGSVDSAVDRWDIGSDDGGIWISRRAAAAPMDDVFSSADLAGVAAVPVPKDGTVMAHDAPRPLGETLSEAAAGGYVVDLLMLYTPELAVELGGEAAVVEKFVFLTELLNQTLAASQIPHGVRLLGIEQSGISNAIDSLDASIEMSSGVETPALREAYGADIVVLIRKKTLSNGNAGYASPFWQPGSPGWDDQAYAVSHLGCETTETMVSCGDDDVFLHEVGHLFGGGHIPGAGTGWKPYAHAYVGCGLPNEIGFEAVSVIGSGGYIVRMYSNPNVLNDGVPCGDAVSDNARAINEAIPYIADYRAPVFQGTPSVKLGLDSVTVEAGTPVRISWISSRALACVASGAWSGSKEPSGSETLVPALGGTYTFSLSCTGPDGDASDSAFLTVTDPEPTLSLTIEPSIVPENVDATLTWTATNATTCEALNEWSGDKPLTGTEVVSRAAGVYLFSMSCEGPGGSVTAFAALTVAAAPTVSLSVAPSSIEVGGSATLTWTASNAMECAASGAWSGEQPLEGTASVAPLAAGTYDYEISCEGPGGQRTASASLAVRAAAAGGSSNAGGSSAGGGGGGGGGVDLGTLVLLALLVGLTLGLHPGSLRGRSNSSAAASCGRPPSPTAPTAMPPPAPPPPPRRPPCP